MPFNLSSLNANPKPLERIERLYFPKMNVVRRREGVEKYIYKKTTGEGRNGIVESGRFISSLRMRKYSVGVELKAQQCADMSSIPTSEFPSTKS
ncbi:hypothetical protein NPIL_157401 [Nephila pilipes]|uniref:Uncharacterized protein n=1 Tax=Nephila pilipes TaxID=299642 RepID=A0A8X6PBU7_NEPPI|nr:hypothetical protein NPIL_157401 [Nephila pilipes]